MLPNTKSGELCARNKKLEKKTALSSRKPASRYGKHTFSSRNMLSANANLLSAELSLLSVHGNLFSAERNMLSAYANLRSVKENLLSAQGDMLSAQGISFPLRKETYFDLMYAFS